MESSTFGDNKSLTSNTVAPPEKRGGRESKNANYARVKYITHGYKSKNHQEGEVP